MRKYLKIFNTSLRQESKTIANAITSMVSFVVIIYIFNQLWRYIYGDGGTGKLINGYSVDMMIWYMITAEVFMYSVNARGTVKAFSRDIKSGKIAYQLNKPYNYYFYQISTSMGEVIWKFIFLVPIAIIMGLITCGPIKEFNALFIIPIFISILCAMLLTCAIYGAAGLMSFWVEEAAPFAWIIQKFQMLFGLFFPPEFFPVWLQPIINYSPIYAMMSGPCKLVAAFSWELFSTVILSQIFWLLIFIALGLVLYKLGSRKVNVHGG